MLHTAKQILASLGPANGESSQLIAARLRDSVIRPLSNSSATAGRGAAAPGRKLRVQESFGDLGDTGTGFPGDLGEALWDLACAVTALLAEYPDQPELAEAATALQDLAVSNAEDAAAEGRLAQLRALSVALRNQRLPRGPDGQ